MRVLLSSLAVCVVFVGYMSAEPSAFEMQSGATKKDMRDLKDVVDFTRSAIAGFQNKLVDLEQSVDGLKSVYDSVSFTSRQDSLRLRESLEKIENLSRRLNSYQSTQKSQQYGIDSIKAQIETNSSNIEQLNKKIDKLSESFLKSNEEIVKQIQVLSEQALALQDSISNMQNTPPPLPVEPITDSKRVNKESPVNKFSSNDTENLSRARSLFRQGKLDESREYFEYLVGKKFAEAESNYYLGEIYYTKKEYNDALPYYKTSAGLDSKASYMPILLWHTAWSFKYLDDPVSYKRLLETLVSMFPTSEQGVRAKDILKK